MWPVKKQALLLALAFLVLPSHEASLNFKAKGHADDSATPSSFEALDTDGSGTISKAEVRAFGKRRGFDFADLLEDFNDMDTNGDGLLQADEVEAAEASPDDVEAQDSDGDYDVISGVSSQAAAPRRDALEEQRAESAAEKAEVALLEDSSVQVKQQTGGMVAAKVAKMVSSVMGRLHKDEDKASRFEELAQNLRGNATSVMRRTPREIQEAAKRATEASRRGALKEIHGLHARADKVEIQAKSLLAEANEAKQQALQTQWDLTQTMSNEVGDA